MSAMDVSGTPAHLQVHSGGLAEAELPQGHNVCSATAVLAAAEHMLSCRKNAFADAAAAKITNYEAAMLRPADVFVCRSMAIHTWSP